MALLKLSRLFRWIIEIWGWLAEGKILFMCILIIVSALTLSLGTWRSETSIKTAGFILQVLGMIFAIRGLLRLRSHFGQPHLRRLFIVWLKRFPKLKRSIVVEGVGTAHVAVCGMMARAEVWTPDNPDQTMEKRLEGINRNLDRIRKELGDHANSINELRESQDKQRHKMTEHIKNIEEKLRFDMETLHTSDLLVSIVGLVWLTIGITMSTMAPEFVIWLK